MSRNPFIGGFHLAEHNFDNAGCIILTMLIFGITLLLVFTKKFVSIHLFIRFIYLETNESTQNFCEH